jgi:putative hydrolase of the HAD superfamily
MIRNVVFDVGNVFVRWSPAEVVERCFKLIRGEPENARRAGELFTSEVWLGLNRGELTWAEAQAAYCDRHGLTEAESRELLFHAMDHLDPVEGTEALARRLKAAGYRLFAITDTVHEIVSHLQARYRFWELFEGAAVSAELGVLKPDPRIYAHLLDRFGLAPHESVFLDDVPANVEGARKAGMQGFVFATAAACERDLRGLGLAF